MRKMGAPITEYMLEYFLRTGLELVRNQPSLLDIVYENLNEGIFATFFGPKVINEIKDAILNRNINIIQGLNEVPEKLPCYSLLVTGTTEDSNKSFFDDFSHRVDTDKAPAVLGTITTTAYDAASGFISVPDNTDFTNIYIGGVVQDASATAYDILGPIVTSPNGAKGFYIVNGASFAVGTATLYSQINTQSVGRNEVPLYETVQVGVHTERSNFTKHLYFLLIYLLSSRRLEMENIGYHISKFNGSEYMREQDLLPSNIFSRYINITFWTKISWTDNPWQALGQYDSNGGKILVKQDVWKKDDDTFVGTVVIP